VNGALEYVKVNKKVSVKTIYEYSMEAQEHVKAKVHNSQLKYARHIILPISYQNFEIEKGFSPYFYQKRFNKLNSYLKSVNNNVRNKALKNFKYIPYQNRNFKQSVSKLRPQN